MVRPLPYLPTYMINKEYYYFFDLNEILIERYPAKISFEILKLDPDAKFVFIYSEQYGRSKPNKIPKNSVVVFMPTINSFELYELFKIYKPKNVTTIAQRIPDMLIVFLSNELNIPTYTVQHGIWSNKIERISVFSALLSKLNKIIFYLKNSYNLSKALNINYISFVNDAYKFFYKDNKFMYELKSLRNTNLRAKKVFAFDPSWNSYYERKYGYSINQLIYSGNPDILLLKNKKSFKVEKSICYICQSLVEDGRYLEKDFNIFLKLLINNIPKNKKLYIKVHPRTKLKNYNLLRDKKNIIFTSDFPLCTHYLGHYSSLLLIASMVSSNVLIWKLKNHYIPTNFYKYASDVTHSVDELKAFFSKKNKNKINKSLIKPESPYKIIAQELFVCEK